MRVGTGGTPCAVAVRTIRGGGRVVGSGKNGDRRCRFGAIYQHNPREYNYYHGDKVWGFVEAKQDSLT